MSTPDGNDRNYRLDPTSPILSEIATLASDPGIRLSSADCKPCTKKPKISAMRNWSLMDWRNPTNDFEQIYSH